MIEKDFKIRKLKNTKEDRSTLLSFDTKLGEYEKTLEPRVIKTEKVVYNDNSKILSDRTCAVFVVEKDTVPIGYVVGKIKNLPKWWKDKKYGYIECMYVEPTFRGKNAGFTLFTAVKEWFNEKGCTSMRLRVFANNTKTIARYKKWGFDANIITMNSEI